MSYNRTYKNYDKFPSIKVDSNYQVQQGWDEIFSKISQHIEEHNSVAVIDCYQGVFIDPIIDAIKKRFPHAQIIVSTDALKPPKEIREMVFPDVTDDQIFGFMTRLTLKEFFAEAKIAKIAQEVEVCRTPLFIVGVGASLFIETPDIFVYADMARWEIQQRQRGGLVDNLGVKNRGHDPMALYKQSYFVDWPVLDKHKQQTWSRWDFYWDTNQCTPKMVSADAYFTGLEQTVTRPFRVVPFFDPGVWGGQWMREVCDLDDSPPNYAWCFDCVPEENSLLLEFNEVQIETPSLNLVLRHPQQLLGSPVHARFGKEFPIRFDFLDTMEGGHLSLQVHPLTEYIQEKFGMHYTQDESYYILDAEEEGTVYLGVKTGVNPEDFQKALVEAQEGGEPFPEETYVNKFPAKKHDHFLIPAGTVHCSGRNCMVLEISSTPYIFTFKMWDWGRLGMDGKPRPINIEHAVNNIQWGRDSEWVEQNLINKIEPLNSEENWQEERTGLHPREFIETRRHWFSEKILLNTNGQEEGALHVLNLVEGEAVVVESPKGEFSPFEVHYAETFIVPASVGEYTIVPQKRGGKCGVIKASVRG